MKVEGRAEFAAPRERVFATFTSIDALSRATPGVQSMEETAPDKYDAVLKVGVAGISGVFKGKLELREKRPPEHYDLLVTGEGSPGHLTGNASFDFVENNGVTTVTYAWDVQVGGMIAGVGQRVLGGVAKMMIGQFMEAMAKDIAL